MSTTAVGLLRRERWISSWRPALALVMALLSGAGQAEDGSWFDDLERYTPLRHTRIDIAGPEPAGFTALAVAPFLTAQALAASDVAFAVSQVVDDQGNPRVAASLDLAPLTLTRAHLELADYQHNREQRFISRIQLSVAVSQGEGSGDVSTRFAPTLRVVLHEQRDPRVHRGPGSLKDCFERHVASPEAERRQQAERWALLQAAEQALTAPTASEAELQLARQRHESLLAQWAAGEDHYRQRLRETVVQGMKACRDDPQVAAYTWNATGHAIGIAPSLRSQNDGLGKLEPRGFVAFATTAYGFDALGTRPTYVPSFLGRHAQLLGQVLYRRNEPLRDPRGPGALLDADQLAVSVRLRGGNSPWNLNLESALIHDWFENGDQDSFYKFSAGADLHLGAGTWMSVAAGRSFWPGSLPNETSLGLSIKHSLLN